MKLLFDQNISFRIIKLIQLAFPQSEQIRKLNLENKSDKEIWTFAGRNGFTIVTFDADFLQQTNLLFGLTLGAVVRKGGPLATVNQVADAAVFGPALIEVA